MIIRRIIFGLLALLAGSGWAAVRPVNDSPNFVQAYLIVVDPGGELYSQSGHAALRLVCKDAKLDVIFSYESEEVSDRVLTFLAGRLKMGLVDWRAEECLRLYRQDGRGVMQYPLNLPGDVKCRLWKVLDDHVAEGMELPYDYLERGCAQAVLKFLMEAAKPYELVVAAWPENFKERTRREVFRDCLAHSPWSSFFVLSIAGMPADYRVSPHKCVMAPRDLLKVLQQAKVAGKPVIGGVGERLIVGNAPPHRVWFTPTLAACLFLVLVLVGRMFRVKAINVLVFIVYCLISLFYVYLVGISSLPVTEWHWLVVPFNLLPVFCWRWHQEWGVWFAGVLLAWLIGVLSWPHLLVDPAWLIVVFAYVVYFGTSDGKNRLKTIFMNWYGKC